MKYSTETAKQNPLMDTTKWGKWLESVIGEHEFPASARAEVLRKVEQMSMSGSDKNASKPVSYTHLRWCPQESKKYTTEMEG